MREPRGPLAESGDALDELHFGGASAGDKFRVPSDSFDNVDAVVDCALDVIEVVLRRAADDERRGAGGVVFLSEDRDAVAADLKGFNDVYGAHFVGHRGTETGKGGSADDAAETAEFEFGEDFDEEDAVAVEVVEGEFADGGAGDDNTET